MINASPEPAEVLNLTQNMGNFRVVDHRALVSEPTFEAKITIAGKNHRRRVIRSDAIVAVIQETDQVAPGADGWHTESKGDARGELSLVQPYSGDRKCSSSTWWNTGNPRNLFEYAVLPITTKFKIPSISEWSLWSVLEKRYERIRHSGRPPMGWFKAPPDQLLDDVNAWLRDGHQLQIDSSWALPQQVQDRYVYLVAEANGQFVKLGKCDSSKTSPPIRRLCQYQPSNPRRLDVVASWKSDTPGSIERTLQAMLRRWCVSNGRRFGAEWFEISSNDALDVLQRGISRFNLDVGLLS